MRVSIGGGGGSTSTEAPKGRYPYCGQRAAHARNLQGCKSSTLRVSCNLTALLKVDYEPRYLNIAAIAAELSNHSLNH
jgi:hypothetical protein